METISEKIKRFLTDLSKGDIEDRRVVDKIAEKLLKEVGEQKIEINIYDIIDLKAEVITPICEGDIAKDYRTADAFKSLGMGIFKEGLYSKDRHDLGRVKRDIYEIKILKLRE